jgi:hypothetical protein
MVGRCELSALIARRYSTPMVEIRELTQNSDDAGATEVTYSFISNEE